MANGHNAVAHNWAHQTGKARKGFNMFYEGAVIYSYGHHFPIARIDRERGVTLMTSKGYSPSTGKHKTITRRAIVGPVLVVPNVMANGPHAHEENCEALLKEASDAFEQSKRRRRADRAAWDLATADRALTTLAQYVALYGVAFHLPSNMAEASVTMAQCRREVAQRIERQRREAEKSKRDGLRKWLRGEADTAPHTSRPYVRVTGGRVQTSWGVEVPLALALRVFRAAQRRVAANLGPFLHYGNAEVLPGGDIRVGCHRIPYHFAALAACKAGLLKA